RRRGPAPGTLPRRRGARAVGDAPRPLRPAPPPHAGRSGRGGDRPAAVALLRPRNGTRGADGGGPGRGRRGGLAVRLGVGAALVDGAFVPGDVELVDGRVAAVGLSSSNGKGIASPGFVDLQVNGFAGVDFFS